MRRSTCHNRSTRLHAPTKNASRKREKGNGNEDSDLLIVTYIHASIFACQDQREAGRHGSGKLLREVRINNRLGGDHTVRLKARGRPTVE